MEPNEEQDPSNFWDVIDEKLEVPVQPHIKNLFNKLGLANEIYVKRLGQRLAEELQAFARGAVYASKIPPNSEKVDYYGHYANSPSSFNFSPGESLILDQIVALCTTSDHSIWRRTNSSRSLKRPFAALVEMIEGHHFNREGRRDGQTRPTLLRMINRSLIDNSGVNKENHRFEKSLKLISMYIFLIGGRHIYDTISANLPMPSLGTIYRMKGQASMRVEGECDFRGLRKFRDARQLTCHVIISEDATKNEPKLQYDSRTDQVIGFIAPKNVHAMPRTYSFKCTSLRALHEYYKTGKITVYLYVFVIQFLQQDAPFFCLTMYGDDSSFITEDCLKRWQYIFSCLEKNGFHVEGMASDGDQRLLKAMRLTIKLGNPENENPYNIEGFQAECVPRHIPWQDFVHVITKFRTRILKASIILALGDFPASASHLHYLVENFPRAQHKLTESALKVNDAMNFDAARKMCDGKVITALERVPGSEGTRAILKVMNFLTYGFLSIDMNPLLRVYCAWYALAFLRIWRSSLSKTQGLSAVHNFVSLNTYICVEINAHGLVNMLIKQIQDRTREQLFLPWMFGSQSSEALFRLLRSLTPTFLRVVNCTTLEAIRKLQMIEILGDILAFDFSQFGEHVHFPRRKSLNASFEKIQGTGIAASLENDPIFSLLLSIESLKIVMFRAIEDAFRDLTVLGLAFVSVDDALNVYVPADDDIDVSVINQVQGDLLDQANDIVERNAAENEAAQDLLDPEDLPDVSQVFMDLRNYSDVDGTDECNPRFFRCKNREGRIHLILKSSAVWAKNRDWGKPSTDRRYRFQHTLANQSIDSSCSVNDCREDISRAQVTKELHIYDWCMFRCENSEKCLIGFVLMFGYPDGSRWKDIGYSLKYVVIGSESSDSDTENDEDAEETMDNVEGNVECDAVESRSGGPNQAIEDDDDQDDDEQDRKRPGVLCNWFNIDHSSRRLTYQRGFSQGWVDISRYKLTLPRPTLTDNGMFLPLNIYREIKDLMFENAGLNR